MRFADYFGRSFVKVSGSQFPWMKMLKESSVAKMVAVSVPLPIHGYKVKAFVLKSCVATVLTVIVPFLEGKVCFCEMWLSHVHKLCRFDMEKVLLLELTAKSTCFCTNLVV